MKVLLCGHTGSVNRGCEAIIRSTAKILNKSGVEYSCLTFDEQADKKVGLDLSVPLIPYPKKGLAVKSVSMLHKKIANDYIWGNRYTYKKVLDKIQPDMILNVGGDTYCYGVPWISVALNIEAERRNIPTVFWGCSVEKSVFGNEIMRQDINRYSYINSRESLSTEILKGVFKNTDSILQSCDPAFQLPINEIELPEGFIDKNTVGINLSPVTVSADRVESSIVYRNVCNLIDYICSNTDMNVCLIPHVYTVNPQSGDFYILKKLFEKYKTTQRVSLVDKELSCTQLKYIISRCRFFIGARTHSMIAAYSTCVPAIGLSYSIKSRGLAGDIMGQEDGYAIGCNSFKGENELKDAFCRYLYDKEEDIKKRYSEFMPDYKKSIFNVAESIFNNTDK